MCKSARVSSSCQIFRNSSCGQKKKDGAQTKTWRTFDIKRTTKRKEQAGLSGDTKKNSLQ